jgi:hypothetical protein
VTPVKPWFAKCPESGTSPSASFHHTSRRRYPDRATVRPNTSHQHHAENPPSTYPSSSPPLRTSTSATIPQLESSARISLAFPSPETERTNPRCPTRDLRSNPRPRHPPRTCASHRTVYSMQPRCEIAHLGPSTHAKHGVPHLAGRQGFVREKKKAPRSEEH